jgi:hypothetical protein
MAAEREPPTRPKPLRLFTCLQCGVPFEFPYTTGRKPETCSRSCQDAHLRRQKKAREAGLESGPQPDWPTGRLPPSLDDRVEAEPVECSICGRPLHRGEDFGAWRLRASRPSPRYAWRIWTVCPAHYGERPRFHGEGAEQPHRP